MIEIEERNEDKGEVATELAVDKVPMPPLDFLTLLVRFKLYRGGCWVTHS